MKLDDLKLSSYDYHLPEDLIARYPADKRSDSRLMVYDVKTDLLVHTTFKDIAKYLPSEALIVRNNSKVFPCRLLGNKSSGGKAEVFLLSLSESAYGYPCLIKTSGKKKVDDQIIIGTKLIGTITKAEQGKFWIKFNISGDELQYELNNQGEIPLPPYMNRASTAEDKKRYQTVYADKLGSVAAPTAGLHFDNEVFQSLSKKNIEMTDVTLHVGIGTFKPVETEDILKHDMHFEYFEVKSENFKKIKANTDKLYAVGTTSLRVLETLAQQSWSDTKLTQETNIFLHPGVEIKSIQGLITNFHLPKSSLLMLVSSLIGREKTLELYAEAINERYRFYSYGDAMLILR